MHHIFPSNFVYWEKLNNHQEIKQKYLSLILDDTKKNYEKHQKQDVWKCKVTTNFFDENSIEFFDEHFVEDVIKKPLNNCITEMNFKVPSYYNLTSIWYNVYDGGEFQEVHQHSGQSSNFFSGIYLLDLEDKNTTYFYQSGSRPDVNTFGYTYSTDHIKEGSVIIFPSSLEHYVNPIIGKKISVSFNVATFYDFMS
jgi:hypothetical protein